VVYGLARIDAYGELGRVRREPARGDEDPASSPHGPHGPHGELSASHRVRAGGKLRSDVIDDAT